MSSNAILQEAQELKDVSERLEAVSERHPPITEALLTICGTIRSTAVVLEVLVATKLHGGRPA